MLKTKIAGLDLDCCIYNASGPRTGFAAALKAIAQSRAGAVLSKSATLEKRDGNPMPRYMEVDLGGCVATGSINSEGLPNMGVDYYIGPKCTSVLTPLGKPYIVSLSGMTLKDNLEMLGRAMQVPEVAAIELNLACPNVPGKPVIAYDFTQMTEVLEAVVAHPDFKKKPLGVKLAPYFDMPHFQQAAEILNRFPIQYVVCTNTMGNALIVDPETETPVIAPNGGHGGLGGGYIKQIALANVRQLSTRLRKDIDVVGCGGVQSGTDAFELILCGASAVQVGTTHRVEGPECFDRIAAELEEVMKRKGYKSLADFKGKLKQHSGGKEGKDGLVTKQKTDKNNATGRVEKLPMWAVLVMFVLSVLVAVLAARDPAVRSLLAPK